MSGIELHGLTKRFGEFEAVSEVDLTIPDRAFCVILGPSGCGKSTILNCIAGLEPVTGGRIHIGGVDVTELAPHERNVAMVFQSSLLYPHLTARQNIFMSLKRSGMKPDAISRRVVKATQTLEIQPILDKKPSALSGGERQRVAMAKAIVREPAAFLMDEPLAALDAMLRQSLRSELVALQKRLGTTTVFVTHDQIEAMTMSDVTVVMKDGRIEQVGSPSEIYDRPRSRFVAGFIGSPRMNFMEGQVATHGSRVVFNTACGTFTFLDGFDHGIRAADRGCTLGIRPQHVRIDPRPGPDRIEATVYAVENLGREVVVLVRDEHEHVYRILSDRDRSVRVGDAVHVALDMRFAFLFDR